MTDLLLSAQELAGSWWQLAAWVWFAPGAVAFCYLLLTGLASNIYRQYRRDTNGHGLIGKSFYWVIGAGTFLVAWAGWPIVLRNAFRLRRIRRARKEFENQHSQGSGV